MISNSPIETPLFGIQSAYPFNDSRVALTMKQCKETAATAVPLETYFTTLPSSVQTKLNSSVLTFTAHCLVFQQMIIFLCFGIHIAWIYFAMMACTEHTRYTVLFIYNNKQNYVILLIIIKVIKNLVIILFKSYSLHTEKQHTQWLPV